MPCTKGGHDTSWLTMPWFTPHYPQSLKHLLFRLYHIQINRFSRNESHASVVFTICPKFSYFLIILKTFDEANRCLKLWHSWEALECLRKSTLGAPGLPQKFWLGRSGWLGWEPASLIVAQVLLIGRPHSLRRTALLYEFTSEYTSEKVAFLLNGE